MKHKHHIIPRHAGGTDDSSNIIELTVEEHAEAHHKLFEEYGRWQDQVAYRMLSGQISSYEATIEAIKRTQTGRKHSEAHNKAKSDFAKQRKWSDETRKKISESNKGRIISDEQKIILSKTHKGKKLSEEHKEIMRKTHMGKPKSDEQRKKMSESAKLAWQKRKMFEEGGLVPR